MLTNEILLVGAGGHGRVVFDALLESGIPPERIRISDDSPIEQFLPGAIACRPALQETVKGQFFHVAVGTAKVRKELTEALLAMGGKPLTVRHPTVTVSRFAEINHGSFLAAMCIIGPRAKIGCGVIVNHGAIVDHDSSIGDFSHIAPNATIGGGVTVGPRVLVGAGAVILPGLAVGSSATIGAGAVVVGAVEAGAVYAGVPARSIGGR